MDYCLAGDLPGHEGAAAIWHRPPDLDLDGDGRPDAIGLDFDGDGLSDDALADLDGDGVADHAVLDLDDDGTAERRRLTARLSSLRNKRSPTPRCSW